MTQMAQEEIVSNTKTVMQGLEALRVEHVTLMNNLAEGSKTDPDKMEIVKKNMENIELGLSEAQVSTLIHCFLSFYGISFIIHTFFT